MRVGLPGALPVREVISRDNPLFKSLRKLASSGRERRKEGRTLLDGSHLVAAYRDRIGPPEMLVVTAAAVGNGEVRGLLGRMGDVPITVLADGLFRELSPVETPTGLLALVAVPRLPAPAGARFALFLEAVQDPGNLGSILRTAAAAGVEAAYLSPGCADAWSPKVLRGGMGAHFVLPLREGADLVAAAGAFGGKVVVAALQGEHSLYELDLSGPVAFVVGNEGAGVSPALQQTATHTMRIPMAGGVESLNAAAATAVCLFERVRQAGGVTGY